LIVRGALLVAAANVMSPDLEVDAVTGSGDDRAIRMGGARAR
jgi:hypothetical protein